LHKSIFCSVNVTVHVALTQRHVTIYVSIAAFSARCYVTLPLRRLKISNIQIYSFLRLWRI